MTSYQNQQNKTIKVENSSVQKPDSQKKHNNPRVFLCKFFIKGWEFINVKMLIVY